MKNKLKTIAILFLTVIIAAATFGIVGCKNSNENSVDYSAKIAQLEQQIKELQDNQVTDNSEEIANLQQKIDSLKAKGKTDSATIAQLEQQIKELQDSQATDNSEEIANLQQKIDSLEANGKTDSATIAELEQQMSELETRNKADRETITKLEQQIKDLQLNLLNCNYKFFNIQQNRFEYNDFDYTMTDTDYSHELGSEENELIFSKILSGEFDYVDYFDWFLTYPDYIYRYTEESLKCIEAVIREGEFTEELRAKYFGFYVYIDSAPQASYLNDGGMSSVPYQIYFNDDWTIFYISQTETLQDNELKKITKFYNPIYDEEGNLNGYYLSFINLSIKVDMGDGKFADCSVEVTYYQTPRTESVWNGETQEHEDATYLSKCRIIVDDNNNYSGGYTMFDSILLYTKSEGLWDIQNVWAAFREEALVPSLNLYPGKSEQKIRIFNPWFK